MMNKVIEIIICPECKGTGKIDVYLGHGDHEFKECPCCKGKRVVNKVTTIESIY